MKKMIEKLSDRLEMDIEDLPTLYKNAEKKDDKTGIASSMLVLTLRFIGIAEYIVEHNVLSFKNRLNESSSLMKDLFERFNSGEPIDESFVAMLSYKELFNSLAAGNFELAQSLASLMGGRDAIEKDHDHPFDYALGYTLRAAVLNRADELNYRIKEFESITDESENKDFRGYTVSFKGILSRNDSITNEGLKLIVEGHKNQCKRGGVFASSIADKALCVWGIGMANLARFYSIESTSTPPLIPDDLLV